MNMNSIKVFSCLSLFLAWSMFAESAEICTSDAQCDDGLFCNGPEKCLPENAAADIKGCVSGSVALGGRSVCSADTGTYSAFTRDYCDEEADLCRHEQEDNDGDGHSSIRSGGDDCNDNDAEAFPGNVERCDIRGHDEDCDPTTMGIEDRDGDGWNSSKCYNTDAGGQRHYGGKL